MTDYPWHTAPAPELPLARAGVQGRHAGVVTRALANVVDVAIVVLMLVGVWFGVAAIRFLVRPAAFTFPSPSGQLLLSAGLGLLFVYFAVNWAVFGGTFGDRLLGLRVVGPDGERPRWGRSIIRAALCVVFMIGLFWVAVSQDNRSVQDLIVRTSVVYDWSGA